MKLCMKRGVSKVRQMLGPFQILIGGGLGPLGRNRSQEKCLCINMQQQSISLLHQGHLKQVLQLSKMHQARTADLRHARTQEARNLNKLFWDPAVCEETSNLSLNQTNQTKNLIFSSNERVIFEGWRTTLLDKKVSGKNVLSTAISDQ